MEIMNNKEKQRPSQETPVDMAGIVNRNIKALVARRKEDENNKPMKKELLTRLPVLQVTWLLFIHML